MSLCDVGRAVALSRLTNHQEKMAVLRLNIEDFYIGIIISLIVIELSTTILPDVDHDGTGSLPQRFCTNGPDSQIATDEFEIEVTAGKVVSAALVGKRIEKRDIFLRRALPSHQG